MRLQRTQWLLGAVAGLLSGGDDGAIDPLQDQAHAEGVFILLGLPWIAIFAQQPFL